MKPASAIRACSVLLVLGLALGWASPATAADPNDACLMCHADKDAKGAGGKSIAVDGAKFAASVHGELQLKCTDCHADVSAQKLPHADKLKPVACASCHDKAVREYQSTAHAKARKGGNAVAANCVDCHGTHDIKRPKDPTSPTNHVNLVATCTRCHGDDATVAKGHMPGGNIGAKFDDSIHGKTLKGAAKMSAPECTDCHGAHSILPKSDPKSNVSRARIPETCGSCHQPERDAWAKGMHGKLRQDGVLAAPGCTDCHSAHSIQQHEKPTFQTSVIKECGTCHSDYLSTYRDTFHGQVTALGYARMATCASCHGAHEVLPASNPRSKVSAQNRLKTCQACHAEAGANFASFDPHADRHNKSRSVLYYYAARFMELLLFGVFAFFGIHTVLWFHRELRERFARGGPESGAGNSEERH